MLRRGPANKGRATDVGAITWFHSIDLGDGEITPGIKSVEALRLQVDMLGLPEDMSGMSVLDIGGWDGFFSFEAERRGAARVVTLDHFVWALDHDAQHRYWNDCRAEGVVPRSYDEVPELFDEKTLPGRAGFDLARRRLHSRVEPVVGDFMTMDLAPLGRFDLVLFLGVLYHLQDPMGALRRVRAVTAGHAIIETVCAVFPGVEHHPLWEMFETDELDGDPSNWWAPNSRGLAAVCRAAGFGRVEVTAQPASTDPPNPGHDFHYGRAVAHAWHT